MGEWARFAAGDAEESEWLTARYPSRQGGDLSIRMIGLRRLAESGQSSSNEDDSLNVAKGDVRCFDPALRRTKTANGGDQLALFRRLVKKEIGSGSSIDMLVVERGILRDDDDRRGDHQLLDVAEDVDAAAALQHGVDDRHIWVPVENHRGGFVRVRRCSHHLHAPDFLKTPLQAIQKGDIHISQNDGHAMVLTGVSVTRIMPHL